MRRIIFFALVAAVVLIALPIVQFGPVRPSIVGAHPGVHPPSPPTYDYSTDTPGTQPPTSPFLASPTLRQLRTLRLSVPAIVNVGDLQAILPAGFNATEFPAGSGLAVMPLNFDFQGRCERLGVGTFGPASGVQVLHTALNTALNRNELLNLANWFSEASSVSCFNAVFGPGSSRVADVETEIRENRGQLQMKFDVKDTAIGFRVQVQAEGPAAIVTRGHADPAGNPLRGLNEGIFANPAVRFSTHFDALAVPITPANLHLNALMGGQLNLPGGSLPIVGVGTAFTFFRNFEGFFDPE